MAALKRAALRFRQPSAGCENSIDGRAWKRSEKGTRIRKTGDKTSTETAFYLFSTPISCAAIGVWKIVCTGVPTQS